MQLSLPILLCFALTIAAPWMTPFLRRATGLVMAVLPAAITLHFGRLLDQLSETQTIRARYEWAQSLSLAWSFHLDGLSLFFVLIIASIGTLVAFYSSGYLEHNRRLGLFYAYLFFFMGSMLGVVLAGNLLTLYVFWELTTISSFLLIGWHENQRASRDAAAKALLTTALGGLAMLAGLVLLGTAAESFELDTILVRGDAVRTHAYYEASLLLIALGAFTKSAQFPFYFWLPSAMEAPTPVSAYLHSATMVKAGVYLLARLSPVLGGTNTWFTIITGVGATTMLIGAWLAIWERDLKSILAYLTINVLGTLTMLLGIGTPLAIKAAMAYLLSHAFYKGALFLAAGAIDHATHTRDLDQLRGLWRHMPVTTVISILAALSMAGVVPLYGFVAKEMFLEAVWESGELAGLLAAVSILASVLLVTGACLLGIAPLAGRPSDRVRDAREVSLSLWLPPLVLAFGGVAAGLFPQTLTEPLLAPAISVLDRTSSELHLKLWHGMTVPFLTSVFAIAAGLTLFAVRKPFVRTFAVFRRSAGWGPAAWYDLSMSLLQLVASWQTRRLQSGYLGWYMFTILAALVALVGGILSDASLPWWGRWETDVRIYELIALLLILAGAVTAVLSRSRLKAVIALSVVGLNVAWIFNLFGAPDLAMTQIVVESLTVFLFVLAFHHLPHFTRLSTTTARWRDAFIAVATGTLVTVVLLLVTGQRTVAPISDYYAEHSYHLAHGRNVVNVILVDFRALDTLGEITVLAISGTGVYALLRFTKGDLAE